MRFPALRVAFCLAFAISSSVSQLIRFPSESDQHKNLRAAPGKPCSALRGQGKCRESRDCPPDAKKDIAHTCGFYGEKFYICCPEKKKDSLTSPGVPSPVTRFRCGERGSIQLVPEFGERQKRNSESDSLVSRIQVVGGIESTANSWPWMVLLGRKGTPQNKYFCSAVLINNYYALTAAHCLLDPSPLFARLGEHDHSKPALLIVPPEDIHIQDVIIHPNYDIDKGYYDIAILKLATPVTFRNEIRPVCLPWGSIGTEDLVGENVTIAGWGSEQFGGSGSQVLREVEVAVFEPSHCERSYSTLSQFSNVFPEGMTRQNIVCAGNSLGGKDSCQGDSGGPIVHREEVNFYTLAGIISRGYGCGKRDFPGLYTPIRNNEILRWIKREAF